MPLHASYVHYITKCKSLLRNGKRRYWQANLRYIVRDSWNNIPSTNGEYAKSGLVWSRLNWYLLRYFSCISLIPNLYWHITIISKVSIISIDECVKAIHYIQCLVIIILFTITSKLVIFPWYTHLINYCMAWELVINHS